MDKITAFKAATGALDLLIRHQPSLFADPNAVANRRGASLADFCHDFMEQYAKRLMERKDQPE